MPARITPPNINFDMSRQYFPSSCIINSRFFCFIINVFRINDAKIRTFCETAKDFGIFPLFALDSTQTIPKSELYAPDSGLIFARSETSEEVKGGVSVSQRTSEPSAESSLLELCRGEAVFRTFVQRTSVPKPTLVLRLHAYIIYYIQPGGATPARLKRDYCTLMTLMSYAPAVPASVCVKRLALLASKLSALIPGAA